MRRFCTEAKHREEKKGEAKAVEQSQKLALTHAANFLKRVVVVSPFPLDLGSGKVPVKHPV